MSDEQLNKDEQLHKVEQLADEFLTRRRQGEHVSISDFVAEHPANADQLRDFIEALQLVTSLKKESPKSQQPKPPQPTQLPGIDDYRIIRELGRGAMGIVCEAEQISLGRRVALKTMISSGGQSDRERQRFLHEARTASKLHHPGIVPVFDVGEAQGVVYYAMQYIDGCGLDRVTRAVNEILNRRSAVGSSVEESLANWLVTGQSSGRNSDSTTGVARDKTSTLKLIPAESLGRSAAPTANQATRFNYPNYCRSVAQIGNDVARALEFAHDQGVIHRDIKPANLLLDTNGQIWVADFGLVKTKDSDLTQTGAFVGTLRYMAPERFKNKCDVRSDVYSLGMTLYELLALRPALNLSLIHI